MVASTSLVSEAAKPVSSAPTKTTKTRTHTWRHTDARGTEKQKMAHICLESMWRDQTDKKQWPNRATQQIAYCLAPSTVSSYNTMLKKLHKFCELNQVKFPPDQSNHMAQFLCELADKSQAPRSQVKVAMAAYTHMYNSYGYFNVLNDYHLQRLVDALIKTGTYTPMQRSKVMPIEPFRELFRQWPENAQLCIKELRLKAITLLALLLMLRPSDIAPKSVHFDGESSEVSS